MAAQSDDSFVEVILFDRQLPLQIPRQPNCEELWRNIARKELGIKPSTLELFGLKHGNVWLCPSSPVPAITNTKNPIELRIRFKTPFPMRLRKYDERAFNYYYDQIRYDFDSGLVLKNTTKEFIKENNAQNPKWYVPVIPNKSDDLTKKRKKMLANLVNLISFNIVVDCMTKDKEKKELFKHFDTYVPKESYIDLFEWLIGSAMGKMKQTSSTLVEKMLKEHLTTLKQRKEQFLDLLEDVFPKYFDEIYQDLEYRTLDYNNAAGGNTNLNISQKIRLKIVPPFKDSDPYLAIVRSPKEPEEKLCQIEEICNISMYKTVDKIQIEIARKNGIPLYITIHEESIALSFLSTLTGYYRLCEKWIFTLCADIRMPSLGILLESQVHGPVDSQFVKEKFKASPGRLQPGSYLIRQSCERHFTFILHYVDEKGDLQPIHIIQSKDTGTFCIDKSSIRGAALIEDVYNDIGSLIKDLKRPLNLTSCLHPSEFDRAPTLLLCRSASAIKADFEGHNRSGLGRESRQIIHMTDLSQYENYKQKGRDTHIWKGSWNKNLKETIQVAVKQLKPNEKNMLPFSQMCSNATSWDDPTLVKVYGATLATYGSPMALIMEYFSLGPLDIYLKQNRETVYKEDLLEAATALARALMYLEEQKIVHTNVRLANVFVSQHTVGSCFKVKLGDPGLPDYTNESEVHWLSFELLIDSCPTASKCTSKGDVWAFATTLWELFSYGQSPTSLFETTESSLSSKNNDKLLFKRAKEQYLDGHRLPKPSSLEGKLFSIYKEVMMNCWYPIPELRSSPQVILRELNQLLYRVFNAKKVHTYITVDDSISGPSLSPSGSMQTLQTTAGSDDTVIYLARTSSPPQIPPPRKRSDGFDSFGSDEKLQNFAGFSGASSSNNLLVPAFLPFNELIQKINTSGLLQAYGKTESQQNLIFDSRSGSSMDGSLMNSYMSQFTNLTSISSLSSSSSIYSIPSIYRLDDKQISWNKDRPIGEGNFGIVFRGGLTHSNEEWEEVAVKLLKDVNDQGAEKEIQHELELMEKLNHENVVRIKGFLNMINDGMVAIVMEYVREGSLDNYLRTYKDRIKWPQLFIYADNICEGMIYLSEKGIIHRDLAARNILVASEEQVKISDFGLARLTEKDYYMQTSNTNIPVRWMAIESLFNRKYSTSSDVWSFGVILWEMFSYGDSPYLEGCEEFFNDHKSDRLLSDLQTWTNRLSDNARFPKPQGCPDALYEVMLKCWKHEPDNRPKFSELKHVLKDVEMKVT